MPKFESMENLLANLFAFVMTGLLLLFICVATSCPAESREIDAPWFTQTTFLYWTEGGVWHTKLVKVRAVSDEFATACFRVKNRRKVLCFYSVTGTKASVREELLVDEEET